MKRYIMATVGKNILGNLTTGMYGKSVVIYREYIQNSCDQIDRKWNQPSNCLWQYDIKISLFLIHSKCIG